MRDKIIALIDMDCFYVQVEQRADPQYWGKPCAVAQYNPWRGGGIIAVGYEARAFGVKRGFRGDDAKAVCPDIHMFMVEEERGKANLSKYRNASIEVMNVISSFSPLITVERASIDEAFLDLTQYDLNEIEAAKLKHFYEGATLFSNEERLLIGASAVKQIRAAILQDTQFKCSAGISHNKTLSKLAAGMNKPNCQTILAYSGVPKIYENTRIDKVRNLGGKLGDELKNKLGITTMGQLAAIPSAHLTSLYAGKTLNWLMNLREGIDEEAVVARQIPKSIGCGKNFPGKSSLSTNEQVTHWFGQLCGELVERITEDRERNKRTSKLLTVHIKFNTKGDISKSLPMHGMTSERMVEYITKHVLSKYMKEDGSMIDPIVRASVTASKFVDSDLTWRNAKLEQYFQRVDKPQPGNTEEIKPTPSTSGAENDSSTSTTRAEPDFNNYRDLPFASNLFPSESNGTTISTDSIEPNQDPRSSPRNYASTRTNQVNESDNSNDSNLAALFARFSDQNDFNRPTVKRGFFYRKTLELQKKRRLEKGIIRRKS
uniref:DNA polymerase eta n=1 Tax=Tetranychus urticae TaxID=32264 RepID=T1K7Z9_TETUR